MPKQELEKENLHNQKDQSSNLNPVRSMFHQAGQNRTQNLTDWIRDSHRHHSTDHHWDIDITTGRQKHWQKVTLRIRPQNQMTNADIY